MRCSTARRLVQVAHDLDASQSAELQAHLAGCASCRDIAARDRAVDHLIESSLPTAVPSVRASVRTRIAAPRPRRRFHPSIALVPVTALLAVAALLSGLLPGPSAGVLPVRAAWHLQRTGVEYPLAVDPTHPAHLLAGGWGRVYESWNSGNSWHALAPLPPNLDVRAVAVDAAHPHRYVVATKHSIFVSENGGRTWTVTAGSLTGAMNMFLIQDRANPSTFYVGPSILWKSTNAARSFHPAGRGTVFAPDGIQALAVAPDGVLVTGIWGGGVAVSTNGGRTWHRRARGLSRNVMDVTVDGIFWAATDHGLYRSPDGGRHWAAVELPGRRPLFATSVLADRSLVLTGGNGAVYRSLDGGRTWHGAMDGLPLDPYVYGLFADPANPMRLYISLDGDGIYRSDDGGAHWKAMDNGLPLARSRIGTRLLLFRRSGALWITDTGGTDPGVLTVERDVRLAALAPDGAEVAYLAASSPWYVRVLGAGGSAARVAASGSGDLPRALLWAPDASMLAVAEPASVDVTDLARVHDSWPFSGRIVGWTPDGRALVTWQGGTLTLRSPRTGAVLTTWPGRYPVAPRVAADARHLAWFHGERVAIGVPGSTRVFQSPCRPVSWSGDSRLLLLRCPFGVEVRDAAGRHQVSAALPRTDRVQWAPGSRYLLVFKAGGLWSWNLKTGGMHLLVAHAGPVAASR